MIFATFIFLAVLQAPATAISVVGLAEVVQDGQTRALVRFDKIAEKATIVTKDNSLVVLRLDSGSELRLGANTSVTLKSMTTRVPRSRSSSRLKIMTGKIWANVVALFGNEASFEVETENAVAGIRGTSFWVTTGAEGDTYVLEHGALKLASGDKAIYLTGPGASTTVLKTGFTSQTVLSAEQQAELRRAVGGPGAELTWRLSQQVNGEPGLYRNQMRKILRGPENPNNNLLTNPAPFERRVSAAEVLVKVELPR